MDHLFHYLSSRVTAAARELHRSLDGVTEELASAGARPDWRRYRFGAGLDGSIRGIVYHLLIWKEAALEGLRTGGFPEVEVGPAPALEWDEMLGRLSSASAGLEAALAAMSPAELGRTVQFEGESFPISGLFTILLDHDIYHAGQINLIRQQSGDLLD